MKRFVVAAGAVVLTGVLVLLAMAVAQRDARENDLIANDANLPYANQTAQPLSIPGSGVDGDDDGWPPAPIVRGNDRGNDSDLSPAYPTPSNSRALPRATPASYSPLPDDSNTASNNLTEPPPFGTWANSPTIPNASNGPGLLSRTTKPENPQPEASLPGNNLVSSSPPPLMAPSGNNNSLPAAPANSPFAASPPSLPRNNSGSLPQPASQLGNSPSLPFSPNFPAGLPSTKPDNNPSSNSSLGNSLPSSLPPVPNSYPSDSQNDSNARPIATLGAPTLPNRPSTSPSVRSSSDPLSTDTPSLPVGLSTSNSNTFDSPSQSNLPNPIPSFPSSPITNNNTHSDNHDGGSPKANARNANAFSAQTYASPAPGGRQLDGSQNPSMEIQKRAPNEVQVGMPATFTLHVKNVGNATAYDVNVVDAVPKGAKLVRTNPQAQSNGTSGLVWKLGEMAARSEQVLTIELIPETEGEIGSVASVNFAAQASVRTMSTQPKLVVKQLLEPMVLGGEELRIMIEVTNAGTGTARDVRLEEEVPANMRHISGAKVLGLTVGDMAPGASEKYDIDLIAVSPGKISNIVRAVSENTAANESSAQIEVVAPKLQCNVEGPRLRYLERQATYTVSVTNSGTAMATNVDLILNLPSGLQFNSTEKHGEYLPSQHAVMWQLAELAAGKTASVKVTLLPINEGDFVLLMKSQADGVRAEPIEKPVQVQGQSELSFSIEDDNDPIETDGSTTYLIKITNIGTRVDNNIELSIDLPEGAVLEQVDAPVNYKESQRVVVFAPIPQMQSKDQQLIRISVRHTREGTHVVRARVRSKLREVPVVKEESTQVYRDQ
jgi:uncharacterized repeat protein (TIGR01451 family)